MRSELPFFHRWQRNFIALDSALAKQPRILPTITSGHITSLKNPTFWLPCSCCSVYHMNILYIVKKLALHHIMIVKMKEVLLLSSYSSVSQVRSRIPCTGFGKMRASQGPAAAGWASWSNTTWLPSAWESDGAVGVGAEQFLDCSESVGFWGCLAELADEALQFSLVFFHLFS